MSIWNKVLMSMVFCATLFFLYMQMATLKTQQYWREQVRDLERQVALRQEINHVLRSGGTLDVEGLVKTVKLPDGEKVTETATLPSSVEIKEQGEGTLAAYGIEIRGVEQLKAEWEYVKLDRGRYWSECLPDGQPDNEGTISIQFNATPEDTLIAGSIVQVFEEAPHISGDPHVDDNGDVESGQYLGEFNILSVDGEQATLQLARNPAYYPDTMTQLRESVVLSQQDASNTWIIYELMPNDSHELFDSEDSETLQILFGEEGKNEYVRDRKPADDTDLPERIDTDANYRRVLHDYISIFRDIDTQFAFMDDEYNTRSADLKAAQEALAKVQASEQILQDQQVLLVQRKKIRDKEVEEATAHRKRIDEAIALNEAAIRTLQMDNLKKAAQLARIHMTAIHRVNQRVGQVNAGQ